VSVHKVDVFHLPRALARGLMNFSNASPAFSLSMPKALTAKRRG